MENISPAFFPNMVIGFSAGAWLARKPRTGIQRIGASTVPFLPIMFFLLFYTQDKEFYINSSSLYILMYWVFYLIYVWTIPFVHFCNKFDIRRLKSSAIKNLGWIAGNASGIASWQSRVGENSKYYRALTDAGNEDARLSADLYYTWKKQGENEPYNEKKCKKLYKKAGKKIKKADSYMKGSVSKISIQNAD